MNDPLPSKGDPRPAMRLWPGIILALLLVLIRFILPLVSFVPESKMIAVLGGMICGLAIFLWWLFFSRAAWVERLGGIVLAGAGLFVASRLAHPSIRGGMMGLLPIVYGLPVVSLALVLWAAATRGFADGPRRLAMAAILLLAAGFFTLLRTDGVSGEGDSDFRWRWTPTAEDRLLSQSAPSDSRPAPTPTPIPTASAVTGAAPTAATATTAPAATPAPKPAWPGFRGPDRDGVVRGTKIETDWSRTPPTQLWRQPVGPGWSSFAVRGEFLYTQEQRGEEEWVSCYRVDSGKLAWHHADPVRFWESNAGAGPRGTPTLEQGRVYTFGGTGLLNALDADTGSRLWSRNVATETETKTPIWGFSASPLVVDDLVIIAASGRLAAYDAATGQPRWQGETRGGSYSSPHRLVIDGQSQVLMLSGEGLVAVAPSDGKPLWTHPWKGSTIVQPTPIAEGDVLLSVGGPSGGFGIRRLRLAKEPQGWTATEQWTSNGLKPYFNDLVVHRGHAFGFDGSILACVDLQDGKRKWKDGRYGYGQLVALADQDLLLVLSEQGGLALVAADSEAFREITRLPAIQGKTWNHPAVAGDLLLVRNSEEMAAFRLPPAGQ